MAVQALPRHGVALGDVEPMVRDVVAAELARMSVLTAELVRGEHVVY